MVVRILIADNDPAASSRLAETMRRAHFDVELAATSATAYDAAEITLPDLIIVDLMASDPDGIALCQTLKASGMDVPVVFFTARDTVEDRIRGLGAGADGYLAKTADHQHLVALVRAILRRVTPRATTPRQ
jgi:DNA-binding response OmpR family regulator